MSAHRLTGAGVALAALLSISACSPVSGGGGPFSGLFGGGAAATSEAEPAGAASFEAFVGADYVACPRAEVIQGGAAQRVYRGGRSGSNRDLRYQIAINDVARECAATPDGQNRIRVGVQGRVLIGPAGGPGTFTAPVRVVVRTPSQVYENRTQRVSVTIPAGQTLADFVIVEENLQIPASIGDNFIIEVGVGS